MSELAKLVAQTKTFPVALRKAGDDGSRKVAAGLTATARATTRAAAPQGRLNVGRRGAKVGVRYVRLRDGSWQVRATGPYQLIERDTKGHVEPRPGRRKAKTLYIPGVGWRRSVRHPGTRGKHPFEHAVNAFGPHAPKVWQGEVRDALAKTFR